MRGGNQVIVDAADRRARARSRSTAARRDAGSSSSPQKQLTDVTTAVDQVRNAFLAAAAVGLLVAVLLGIAAGHHASAAGSPGCAPRAVRVAREGTDAPTPHDDGRDEVGDLARALATMQRELRRQEAARRAFVATASHELRTPLTSLQGTLELLEEDLRDGDLDQDDARAPGRERPARAAPPGAAGRRAARPQPPRRRRAAARRAGRARRAVPRGGGRVRAARGRARASSSRSARRPGRAGASGDPGAVARVVRILLDNALRHAPPGPRPCASCPATTASTRRIDVADDGPGVPRRATASGSSSASSAAARRRGEGGFGLGLAIGRELARAHGRRAARSPTPPAPGARFVLELPIELPVGLAARARGGTGGRLSVSLVRGAGAQLDHRLERLAVGHAALARDDGRHRQPQALDAADEVAAQPARLAPRQRRDDDLVEAGWSTASRMDANGSGPPTRPSTGDRAALRTSGSAASSAQSAAPRSRTSGTSRAKAHGPAEARRLTSSSSRGAAAVRLATTRTRVGGEPVIRRPFHVARQKDRASHTGGRGGKPHERRQAAGRAAGGLDAAGAPSVPRSAPRPP